MCGVLVIRCPIVQAACQEVGTFCYVFKCLACSVINLISGYSLESYGEIEVLICQIGIDRVSEFRERTSTVNTVVIRNASVIIGV